MGEREGRAYLFIDEPPGIEELPDTENGARIPCEAPTNVRVGEEGGREGGRGLYHVGPVGEVDL